MCAVLKSTVQNANEDGGLSEGKLSMDIGHYVECQKALTIWCLCLHKCSDVAEIILNV